MGSVDEARIGAGDRNGHGSGKAGPVNGSGNTETDRKGNRGAAPGENTAGRKGNRSPAPGATRGSPAGGRSSLARPSPGAPAPSAGSSPQAQKPPFNALVVLTTLIGAQLQGFSQRSIRVDYQGDTRRNQARNPIPAAPTTLGEWLHLKRIEANLTQLDICRHLKIGERRVLAWERDRAIPTAAEWERLRDLLAFDSGLPLPANEKCAGVAHLQI